MSLSDWLSHAENWVFLVIAIPTLAAAVKVVSTSNVVRAVLYLVVTLSGTAALFILLGAEFVGWTVILVYVGAVIILFLMGIMITRAPQGMEAELSHPLRVQMPAALLSIVLFAVIGSAVVDAFGWDTLMVADDATRTASIAEVTFRRFVIPFEVVSLVLLAALIGGIVVARRDEEVTS